MQFWFWYLPPGPGYVLRSFFGRPTGSLDIGDCERNIGWHNKITARVTCDSASRVPQELARYQSCTASPHVLYCHPCIVPHSLPGYSDLPVQILRQIREVDVKAVTYEDTHKMEVQNRPTPELQSPTDAILRVSTSGICGSDLHMYDGRTDLKKTPLSVMKSWA
jgi:hypothetical protein